MSFPLLTMLPDISLVNETVSCNICLGLAFLEEQSSTMLSDISLVNETLSCRNMSPGLAFLGAEELPCCLICFMFLCRLIYYSLNQTNSCGPRQKDIFSPLKHLYIFLLMLIFYLFFLTNLNSISLRNEWKMLNTSISSFI